MLESLRRSQASRFIGWLQLNRHPVVVLLRGIVAFHLAVTFCLPSLFSPAMWAAPSWVTLRDNHPYQLAAPLFFAMTFMVLLLLVLSRPHSWPSTAGLILASAWYVAVVYSLVTSPTRTAIWNSGTANYSAHALFALLGGLVELYAWLRHEGRYPFR